ncbi:MAG: hypothetical protein MRY64_04855 [Hyphomonadaceae bacterium]|nr:hypothetical protein [Hyphomonadaceae bacterium]
MSYLLKSALLGALALLLAALPALACSCMRAESAAAQAETADIVFIGRVIDSGPVGDPRGWWKQVSDWATGRPAPRMIEDITTFQVDEALKGAPGRNVPIRHVNGNHSATCGVSFPRGEAVLILAYRQHDGSGYATSLCSMPQFPVEEFRAALTGE